MPDALRSITADEIRRRFSGSRMPEDPLKIDFAEMESGLPESAARELSKDLRPAGVLVPIIERSDGLSVLLTERAATLKHHAGQVSFPGGGMEPHDSDIATTALREASEEVGIEPDLVEVAGFLNPALTVTGFAVTPVIGFVSSHYELRIDPGEVASAFEVPLDFLMDSRNVELSQRTLKGVVFPVATLYFDGHRIWGATAGILLRMRKYLIHSKNNNI